MFFEGSDQQLTDGSVGWASGCHAGGREFNFDQTNTQEVLIFPRFYTQVLKFRS